LHICNCSQRRLVCVAMWRKALILVATAAAVLAAHMSQRRGIQHLREEIRARDEVIQRLEAEIGLQEALAAGLAGAGKTTSKGAAATKERIVEGGAQAVLNRKAAEALDDIETEVERYGNDTTADVYRWVLRALAAKASDGASPELRGALRNATANETGVRIEALKLLGKLGGPAAAQTLIDAMRMHEEGSVRELAAHTCGQLASNLNETAARRAVMESLASVMLKDFVLWVKVQAATSIGSFAATGPLPPLVRSALDSVRYDAPAPLYNAIALAKGKQVQVQ